MHRLDVYKRQMNYSLSAGGKRLRPILTLEATKIVGGDAKEAVPFAMAIEMIHTYSSVSYTHLDVYKRQIINLAKIQHLVFQRNLRLMNKRK